MATVVAFLSLVLMVVCLSPQTQAYQTEWFGSEDQYKCRCELDCTVDGQCKGRGICLGGWFGPACQYSDLAYNDMSTVTDGDDTTCLTYSPPGNVVTVAIKNKIIFTWLRIRVSNSDFLHQLTVTFNDGSLACLNLRNASVDQLTLDIHCNVSELVQSVTLSGEGVQYLCSVYFNGGRNVALKQRTSQTSIYSEKSALTHWDHVSFPSRLSVDDNTSGDFYGAQTCSCTKLFDYVANWDVSFLLPQHVLRYVLYNRDGEAGTRMIGFNLYSFDQSHTMVFSYTDPNVEPHHVYIVTPQLISQVSLVYVKANNVEHILQMCEVQVYGDSACDKGKYGRECEHDCNCDGGDTCFISTGGCPSGCKAGFYGESCHLRCSPETFGPGCSKNCSQFCVKSLSNETSCDHVNGSCFSGCQSGYDGDDCSIQIAESSGSDGNTNAVIKAAVGSVLVIIFAALVAFSAFMFWRLTKTKLRGWNFSYLKNPKDESNSTQTEAAVSSLPDVDNAINEPADNSPGLRDLA